MNPQQKKAECKHCQKQLTKSDLGDLGPFCSSRCQQADLMEWFGESYKITRPLSEEDLDHPDLQDQAAKLQQQFGLLDPYDPNFS